MGASTPHFALQLRNRIRNLIGGAARGASRRASRASARSRGSTGSPSRASGAGAGASRAEARAASDASRPRLTANGSPRAPALARPTDARARRFSRVGARERATSTCSATSRPESLHRPDAGPDGHARSCRRSTSAGGGRRSGRVAKGVIGPGMADEQRIARLLLGPRPPATACSTSPAAPATSRATSRASVGPDGLAVGLDVSETMLARAVDGHAAGIGRRSPTCAATRRSCRSATRASTRSAASRRCTCSPTR